MANEHPQRFGRYEVRSVLGRGAMGLVYLAEDPLIGRRVAIKVIRAEPGLEAEEAADRRMRFEREFRSAGTLSHPGIVTVYDVGHEDGSSFIAMEYVQGESLQQVIQRSTELSPRAACDLIFHVAAGLDFAHQRGIVHRDVKPANILISREGQAKITDFGVAKQASVTMTRTGTVLGTPAYMSPEQITGGDLAGASDQFSLAIIAYELLTGARPFAGESAPTVLYKIVQEQPPEPSRVNNQLPAAVDTVLAKSLAKDPKQRHSSCVAMVRALREALGLGVADASFHVSSFEPSGSPEAGPHDPTVSTDAGDLHLRPDPATPLVTGSYAAVRGGRRFGLVAAGLASLAVLGAVAFLVIAPRLTPRVAAATVTIATPEPGATLRVDGVPVPETTPARLELEGPRETFKTVEVLRDGEVIATRQFALDDTTSNWEVAEAARSLSLEIVSDPPGATVVFDGEDRGPSPVTIEAERSGTAALALRLAGYRTVEEQLDLGALASDGAFDGRIEHALEELPPPARLEIRGDFEVEVVARGRRVQLRPGQSTPIEAGRVEVELMQPAVGYRERRTIDLQAGRQTTIDLPRVVSVQVAAQPSNCEVWIGGRKVDVVPFSRELVIGSHELEFRWPSESRRVVVEVRGDGQRIFETLTR